MPDQIQPTSAIGIAQTHVDVQPDGSVYQIAELKAGGTAAPQYVRIQDSSGASLANVTGPDADGTGATLSLSVQAKTVVFNGGSYDRVRSANSSPVSGVGRQAIATGVAATQSLSATNVTGAGASVDLGVCVANVNMELVLSGYSVTFPTIQLQGSLEGANWYNIGTAQAPGANGTFAQFVTAPSRFLRANLTAAGTGGTTSAWIAGA